MILTQSLVQSRNHQQNVKVLWKRACEAKRIYELKCREEVGSNQFYHQEVARCGKTSKEAEKVRFISLTHTHERREKVCYLAHKVAFGLFPSCFPGLLQVCKIQAKSRLVPVFVPGLSFVHWRSEEKLGKGNGQKSFYIPRLRGGSACSHQGLFMASSKYFIFGSRGWWFGSRRSPENPRNFQSRWSHSRIYQRKCLRLQKVLIWVIFCHSCCFHFLLFF